MSLIDAPGSDYDVVVVGGGPAGCSAGVFLARYGLETVIFDRGSSSLRRCAYLENYPGFPGGIGVETFYGLLHDHAEEAGCEVVADMVEAVERDGDGFAVGLQDGDPIGADRVLAAARYDADYLRPLDDDAMFETHVHDGEEHEHFDREYPDEDGRTPVDGLYVAAPAGEPEAQAIMAAGHGARVARTVIADIRRERGYPDPMADHWDWMRRKRDLEGEWADRERWEEQFDERLPDDHGLGEDRLAELREREVERRLGAYLPDDEVERRSRRGQERLLEHVDDELVLERAREIEAERGTTETTD